MPPERVMHQDVVGTVIRQPAIELSLAKEFGIVRVHEPKNVNDISL